MKAFLNRVMFDHDLRESFWNVALALGDGSEVVVKPSMRMQLDKDVLKTTVQYRLERQELPRPAVFHRRPRFLIRLRRRPR